MENCIFCKIKDKEIPSYKIYEDDVVYAFLDLSQNTKGHTLLIPKTHVKDIFAYDSTLASEVFARVPKIARALEEALPNMIGLNIVSNNKEAAYQSVFHSHLHLIPRYQDDDFEIKFTNHEHEYTSDELTALAQKIANEVK